MNEQQQQLRLFLLVGVCAVVAGIGYLAFRLAADDPAAPETITPEQAVTLSLNDIVPTATGIELHNSRHTAYFTAEGLTFKALRGPSWQWELTAVSAQGVDLQAAEVQQSAPDQIAYVRGGLTEQYLVHAAHIEQRFVLAEPLTLTAADLTISGRVTSDGRLTETPEGWVWATENGVVSLGNVTVFDAHGQTLPARLEVTADSTQIWVDGESLETAAYPVTIDPFIGTDDFRISDAGTDGDATADAFDPAVAYDSGSDQYLVVWAGEEGNGALGQTEIYGQLLNGSTGNAVGSNDFQISTAGSTNTAFRPDVAFNDTNNQYLVVWQQGDHAAGDSQIYGQRLNSSGGTEGVSFLISEESGDDPAVNPAVAYNSSDNRFFVVWQERVDISTTSIIGQIVSNTGGDIGATTTMSSTGTIAQQPDVAFNSGSNEYFVVWSDGTLISSSLADPEIYGQRVSTNGAVLADSVALSDMDFEGVHPAVVYNHNQNNYLVVWAGTDLSTSRFEIYGQLVTAAGAETGSNDFQISTISDSSGQLDAYHPEVAYNGDSGTFLVTWRGDLVDEAYEIFLEWLSVSDGSTIGANNVQVSGMGGDGNNDPAYQANRPAVAYGGSNGLIVWHGDDNTAGSDDEAEIYGQLVTFTSDCTPLTQADLQVSIDESADPIIAGSGANNLVYTVTVSNAGPNIACEITADTTLTLPSGVTLSSNIPSQNTTYDGSTWTIGNLAVNDSATLTLNITADETAQVGNNVIGLEVTAASTTPLINTADDTVLEQTSIGENFFSVSDGTIAEGDSGQAILSFTVSRTNNAVASAVDVATVDGSATAGSDYAAQSNTVNFAAGGGNSQTFNVVINGDSVVELDETFTVNLSNPVNGSVTDGQGQGTVTNDDAATLTINDVSKDEGDSGQTLYIFNVQLSNNIDTGFTVDYTTADDTATIADNDYVAQTDALSFSGAAGETKSLTIAVNGDTLVETDETFTVELTSVNSSGRNINLATPSGTGTILNDETTTVDFARASLSVTEGDTSKRVSVRLSAPSAVTVQVDYALSNGTATAGSDYTLDSGTLTFAPGDTRESFNVAVLDDGTDEPDETIVMTLSNPANADLGTQKNPSTLVIVDNDGSATVNFSSFDFSTSESNPSITITATLNPPSAQTVTVDYRTESSSLDTADLTADVHLQAAAANIANNISAAGTITFTPGITLQEITIPLMADNLFESDETFTLILENPVNAELGLVSEATITIENDDEPPRAGFDASDLAVDENDGLLGVEVKLNTASGQETTLHYETQGDTATPGDDFTATAGSVTIPTGEITATIPITIVDDAVFEFTEFFTVTLTGADGALLVDNSKEITILDDDPFITPTLSIGDVSAAEGHSGSVLFTFPVALSVPSLSPVIVEYETVGGSATIGTDYEYISSTLTIPEGETSGSLAVIVLGDTTPEQNETFNVVINTSSSVEIADGTAVGTILNDDDIMLPTVSINDISSAEGNNGTVFGFPLTLDLASNLPTEISYHTAAGTAAAGDDFVAITDTLTIPQGVTNGTIEVTVVGDTEIEPAETFMVVIDSVTNGSIGRGAATGTILNDDATVQPLINIGDVTVTEQNVDTVAAFPVSATFAITSPITVEYATSDGTAVADADYVAAEGSLTIPAGFTTGVIEITILGDVMVEPDEGFLVTLSNATNGLVSDGVGIGMIVSEDEGLYLPVVLHGSSANDSSTVYIRR